jgi:hypothetical protein
MSRLYIVINLEINKIVSHDENYLFYVRIEKIADYLDVYKMLLVIQNFKEC